MLLKRTVLQAIARGDVTLAFRRWKKPSVRVDTRLRTDIGVLSILSVEALQESDVSEEDARAAGYSDRASLMAELSTQPQAQLYRIQLALGEPDRDLCLQDASNLTPEGLRHVQDELDQWDRSSPRRAWTRQLLRTIADLPQQSNVELAQRLRIDRDELKDQLRRLNDLGLIEPLHPGHRLSQRGLALLLFA